MGLGFNVLSQETANNETNQTVINEIKLDQAVSAQDLGVKEPKILPGSKFYFLKELTRNITKTLTLNPVKKIELETKYANEKLIELKKLAEKNAKPEIINKAAENYQKAVENVKNEAEKIKENASQNPKIEKFIEKYTNQQILHQTILEKMESQVPPEAYEKIKEARENHLENFKNVMLKLEDEEKIAPRLTEALENKKGSEFKEFKNLELLKTIEEKMPENVKLKIQEEESGIIKVLNEKIENLSPEKKEKLKNYIEQLPGEKEKQLNIMENIKSSLKEKPGCKYYYWFDNNNKECNYKQFCGLFLYQDLRTFETREECLRARNSE